MSAPKAVLVTGATGKQGGSVLKQLGPDSQFTVLAVTRNPESASAKKILERYPNVILVQGDLNDVPALFSAAKSALFASHKHEDIFGVFSVQVFGKDEVQQGTALIDQSIVENVKHFVYSSVDRGGNSKSFENPTPIPHFKSKFDVEHHLLDKAGRDGQTMGWTILRPVAFMDNMAPNFPTKVFLTALRDTLQDKPLQWISVDDIGLFAANALRNPSKFNTNEIGLAGDEMNFEELSGCFERVTGSPAPVTYGLFGSALMWAVTEMKVMITWFKTDGYGVDIPALRKTEPELCDFETWLRERSGWAVTANK